jgi:hypothetical protein
MSNQPDMPDMRRYSVDAAREAAARDDLEQWVADFLASPGSDNEPLGQELTERQAKWWLGPVLVPVARLHRLAGPAEHPVLCPVDEDYWRDDVDDLEGNHRVEGVRRTGADEVWAVIGFDSADERAGFEAAAHGAAG